MISCCWGWSHVMLLWAVAMKTYDPSHEHQRKQWWKVAKTRARRVEKKQSLDDFGGCRVLYLLYEFQLSGHSACVSAFFPWIVDEKGSRQDFPPYKQMSVFGSWLVVFLLIFSGAKQGFLKKLLAAAKAPESFICRIKSASLLSLIADYFLCHFWSCK